MTLTLRVAARATVVLALAAVALLAYAWLRTPGFGPERYLSELGVGTAPHRWINSAGVASAALSALLAIRLVPGRAVAVLLGCGAAGFGTSSAVPCTPTCALPIADGWPFVAPVGVANTLHAGASAGAFVLAACAMLLVGGLSRTTRHPVPIVRRVSLVTGVALLAEMGFLLAWAILVASHGLATGIGERLAVLTAAGWLVVTALVVPRSSVLADTVQLEHSFTLPVPVDDAWDLLLHVDRLAAYVPGATVSEIQGDEFAGTVRLDFGAMGMTYQGEAAFSEKDEDAHRVVIEAAGRELNGSSTASATVIATLEPAGTAATTVNVVTDVTVSGMPSGGAVMREVGERLARQFTANLASRGRAYADRPFGTRPAEDRTTAIYPVPPPTAPTRLPRWLPYAVAGGAALAFVVWRRSRRR